MEHAKCKICQYRKNDIRAVNLCLKCDNLHMCKACTEEHARTRATAEHTVLPLHNEEAEGDKPWMWCDTHDSLKKDYCRSCGHAVCKICILLDHGEHDLQALEDAIHSKIDKVKVGIGEWEVRLKELQKLEEKMAVLKKTAKIEGEREDELINDIEDQALKYMEQVLKWKEQMIEVVRENYRVIHGAPEYVKEVSGIVEGLKDGIEIVRDFLEVTEHFPSQLEDLITLHSKLDAMVEKDGVDAQELHEILNEECNNVMGSKFISGEIPKRFGHIVSGKIELKDILDYVIQEKTLQTGDTAPHPSWDAYPLKTAKVFDHKLQDTCTSKTTGGFEDTCYSKKTAEVFEYDMQDPSCLKSEELFDHSMLDTCAKTEESFDNEIQLQWGSKMVFDYEMQDEQWNIIQNEDQWNTHTINFEDIGECDYVPQDYHHVSPNCHLASPDYISPTDICADDMQDELKQATTPCMAIINSKYYAVAPARECGKPPSVIEIYEFPGTLKRILLDQVYPVFDMSSTPDGKLAVLSLGENSQECAVKLFDPETGYLGSVAGIDVAKPVPLSSGQQSECVILRPYLVDCVFRVPLTHQLWSMAPAA